MRTGIRPDTEPLAVVRGALLERARRDAAAAADAARSFSDDELARAREEAARIVADARSQGVADAAVALGGERSRTLREARGRVLAAEREAYDELRRRTTAGVAVLLSDLAPDVGARVAREAAERLGPDPAISDGAHGPVAVSTGRRLTLEPDHLVDLALAALGPDLAGLWSP